MGEMYPRDMGVVNLPWQTAIIRFFIMRIFHLSGYVYMMTVETEDAKQKTQKWRRVDATFA